MYHAIVRRRIRQLFDAINRGEVQPVLDRLRGMSTVTRKEALQGISPEDRAAWRTLGLEPGADRRALRQAYSRLVREYHPDRYGGDRRFEKQLTAVVEAYQHLRDKVR